MMRISHVLLLLIAIFVSRITGSPNIVMIVADDLGHNDISMHGSNQYMTPNIDAIGAAGVILNWYYTPPICTPARAALLTGRHPIHNGMEHDVIYAPEPWGLPLSESLLPQYLQTIGYVTRAVGKWHLGFFKAEYTPSMRGFDTHYGIWLGHQNHYSHFGYEPHPGYDFHRNLNVSWEASGKHNTDLFTEEAETIINNHNVTQPLFLYVAHTAPHAPLLAPQELVDKFKYIPEKKRQIYAAMVTQVDESVGRIAQALKNKNMLNNSIILFLSDNGGATNGFNGNVASNWPLRGCKDTLWEGGVRGVGLLWSPLLQATPRVHQGLVNVQDWLPTLLSATGSSDRFGNLSQLDGVSQWDALNGRAAPPYQTVLHNIDPMRKIGALRHGKWKIVTGRTYNGKYDGFYGKLNGEVVYDFEKVQKSAFGQAVQSTCSPVPDPSTIQALRDEAKISCNPFSKTPHVIQVRQTKIRRKKVLQIKAEDSTECQPQLAPCLFDIEEDPCEINNVASSNPDVVSELLSMLKAYRLVQPNNSPSDPRSFPEHWNNTWINWQDFV